MPIATGSCMCGGITIALTGKPQFTAVCYCDDDRKMSNVQTWQIPKSQFQVTAGKPKEWTKRSDHGNNITNHFCDTCGTTLYRTGGAAINDDNVGLRAGVLDDQTMLDAPPAIEVYVERRPPWIQRISGAIQLNQAYEPIDDESIELYKKGLEAHVESSGMKSG